MKLNLLDARCLKICCFNPLHQYTPKILCFQGLNRTYHINRRWKASKRDCSRAKIYKKTGQILFTAKAFNSRCLAEWLQRCVHEALQRGLPDDENQLPLLHSALILGPIYVVFFHDWIFNPGSRCQSGVVHRLETNFISCQILFGWERLHLRTAMSTFLGLQEREGRFLKNKEEAYKQGMLLCRRYVDLAKHAIRQGCSKKT